MDTSRCLFHWETTSKDGHKIYASCTLGENHVIDHISYPSGVQHPVGPQKKIKDKTNEYQNLHPTS